MEQFGLALILFAAFWIGCAASYIAMRLRTQVAYEKGRADSSAEVATLKERLATRDQEVAELRKKADSTPSAQWPDAIRASLTQLETQLATPPGAEWAIQLQESMEQVAIALTQAAAGNSADQIRTTLERVEAALQAQGTANPAEQLRETLEHVTTALQTQAANANSADQIRTTLERVEAALQAQGTANPAEQLRETLQQVTTALQTQAANVNSADQIRTTLERVEAALQAQGTTNPAPAADATEQLRTTLEQIATALQAQAAAAPIAQPAPFLQPGITELTEPLKASLDRVESLLHAQAAIAAANPTAPGEWSMPGEWVEPLKDSLARVDSRIAELEKERAAELAGLRQQVEHLLQSQASLAGVLRAPSAPGAWGEVQLRRIVEMAGMLPNCDFVESTAGDTPDLIVRLPNRRQIAIDARISVAALCATDPAAPETDRAENRRRFAAEVRDRVVRLGAPEYWEQFPEKPEFVVAFLPGEGLFGAAIEGDPSLLEFGAEHRVLLATPATLIALLRAVAWGWKQELATADVQEIRDLGQALFRQITAAAAEFACVQQNMAATTFALNRAVGSFEAGVMPSARRLHELGAAALPAAVDEELVKVL